MGIYGYNLPWSGRLGRIATRCVYCGDGGGSFRFCSAGYRCAKCNSGMVPNPNILKEFQERAERLAREWCSQRRIDYDATVANYEKNLGPNGQERDEPIPNADKDFTVYLPTPTSPQQPPAPSAPVPIPSQLLRATDSRTP